MTMTEPQLPLNIERRRCRDCRRALPPGHMYRCPACVLASISRLDENAEK
jgi:hypothetical protein